MLERLGYRRVDVVEDGRLALEAVQARAYDVVLMDIHMPRMDGWVLAYTRACMHSTYAYDVVLMDIHMPRMDGWVLAYAHVHACILLVRQGRYRALLCARHDSCRAPLCWLVHVLPIIIDGGSWQAGGDAAYQSAPSAPHTHDRGSHSGGAGGREAGLLRRGHRHVSVCACLSMSWS